MSRHAVFALLAAAVMIYTPQRGSVSPTVEHRTRYGLNKIPCTAFAWNDHHDVMHVPIQMNGKQYKYQLDTGADEVIPYGSIKHVGWIEKHEGVRIPSVAFAGANFQSIVAYRYPNISDTDLQGSVGLDLLMGKMFVIDFPKQRVCLFAKADMPDELAGAADWSPAEVRHGKFFLSVKYDGRTLKDIFYDTGSSPSSLVVDQRLWKRLTGRSSIRYGQTTSGDAVSWGIKQHFIGAPGRGVLEIGNHTFKQPHVDTNTTKPREFRDDFGAEGLLGNALFMNSIVVLDLGSHAQFGLITEPH